ncbi:hypothetical protein EDB85DRAFT_2138713 [Lactarius pseudohatsudake]|nr:hypothetical protein EDB85DRAFT_2138713 [Lactarius pseudohatsudake]
MAIKLKIHPSSPSLDLLGPPDQSSTYSLSGYVSVSLSPSHSLFEQRRTIRILLRSLVITFEGQTELITPEAGYFAARLCSVSKELVPKTPVELSNEGHEDRDMPCTWHVMFDLPVPGWLPASDPYGDCRQGFSGTQYTLYATLNYTNLEETYGSSWLSSMCTPFSSKTKAVHAEAFRISLNRFALPPPSAIVSYPPNLYSITLKGGRHPDRNLHPIPSDVISKIELLASVPEHISVDGDNFLFNLCMRAPSLPESEAAKLRVARVSFEPQQIEQYRRRLENYILAHSRVHIRRAFQSLPRRINHPHKPLRDAHPLSALYDVGLLATPTQYFVEEVHSLLPEYKKIDLLNKTGEALKSAEGMHPTQWFKMTVNVPFMHTLSECKDGVSAQAGIPRLRATSQSLLFNVKHSMRVNLTFSYDGGDGKPPTTSIISVSLPLDFVRLRSAARTNTHSLPSQLPLEHLSLSDCPARLVTVPPANPYNVPELPAYSQLFHPNGDVRRDDFVPLPLYTPCRPTLGHTSEENTLDHAVIGAVL